MPIINKDGTRKEYIYKSDIQKFLRCDYEKAIDLFERVKILELETYVYEMFPNRVPQSLFHSFINKKKRKTYKQSQEESS